MAEQDDLKVGSRVTFHRSHDTHTKLSGVVKELKGKKNPKDNEVLIATEPSGVLLWVNAAHVEVSGVRRRDVDKDPRPETAAEEMAREAAEETERDEEDIQPDPAA